MDNLDFAPAFGQITHCEIVQPESKIEKVRVNKLAANIVGTLLTILLCAVGLALARVLPNHAHWAEWHEWALIISIVVLLPLHEALHAVGLLWFARVRWKDIRFGVMWYALMPYCGCKVPVSIKAYRQMALFPLVVTGTLSFALLALFPADWLGLFVGVVIAACVGDIWMVAKLKRFPANLLAQDCESEIGCDILFKEVIGQ